MLSGFASTPPRVAVIGAGLAGITTAVTLADAGVSVLLLEKTSRLGGRAGSAELAESTHIPIGNHLFLGCCNDYLQLLEKLGTHRLTHLQPRLKLAVMHAGHLAHLEAARLPHPLPLVPSFLRYPYLQTAHKPLVAYGAASILRHASAHQGETFAQWLTRHRQPLAARRFLWELISAPTLNAPAEEASADLALMVFRLAVFGQSQSSALGFLPKDATSLLQPVARYLRQRGGELRLRTGVLRIELSSEADKLVVYTNKEGCISANSVVLATHHQAVPGLLPTHWLALPYFRALKTLPDCPIVDVFLTLKSPLLTEPVVAIPGLPALWIFTQQHEDGTQELAISISCPGALSTQPSTQIIKWAVERLSAACGQPLHDKLLAARVIKHMRATFSAAPQHQALRPAACAPVPGLFLAGDYTQTHWPATMEGAVRSGMNAAEAILRQYR